MTARIVSPMVRMQNAQEHPHADPDAPSFAAWVAGRNGEVVASPTGTAADDLVAQADEDAAARLPLSDVPSFD